MYDNICLILGYLYIYMLQIKDLFGCLLIVFQGKGSDSQNKWYQRNCLVGNRTNSLSVSCNQGSITSWFIPGWTFTWLIPDDWDDVITALEAKNINNLGIFVYFLQLLLHDHKIYV